MWFTEKWTPHIKFSVEVKKHLYSEKTKFQQMDFYDSYELGRFFTLDGIMMVNQKDEFIYHEMIIHTPMSIHPLVKNVLVIGGGDGGSVRELVKYPKIESIDLVEIDESVVKLCQVYLPEMTIGFKDPRVHLFFEDGLLFVKNSIKLYDLIIVDSTDPVGPGEGLFSREFYQNCYRVLTEEGILINQHESPYFAKERKEMQRAHKKIKDLFPIATVYQAFIPTYPSGHWLFGFASKKWHPTKDFKGSLCHQLKIETEYYNDEVHLGAFGIPNYVKKALNETE